MACDHYEPSELPEIHPVKEGLVNARTVLLKGLDQLLEQPVTLLIPELQDVAKGIHHRVDATQPVKVSLPVSALALGHQLLVGAGEGDWDGGDNPVATKSLESGAVCSLAAKRCMVCDNVVWLTNKVSSERLSSA